MSTATEKWVLHWLTRRGVERPVIVRASGDELRYNLGRASRREVVESALKHARKRLADARESVKRNEQYIAQLEALLAKEPASPRPE